MTRHVILPLIAVPLFFLAVGHAWYIQRPVAERVPRCRRPRRRSARR